MRYLQLNNPFMSHPVQLVFDQSRILRFELIDKQMAINFMSNQTQIMSCEFS